MKTRTQCSPSARVFGAGARLLCASAPPEGEGQDLSLTLGQVWEDVLRILYPQDNQKAPIGAFEVFVASQKQMSKL